MSEKPRPNFAVAIIVVVALALGGVWAAGNTEVGCEVTGGMWIPADSWVGPAAGKFDDQCWRTDGGGSDDPTRENDCGYYAATGSC